MFSVSAWFTLYNYIGDIKKAMLVINVHLPFMLHLVGNITEQVES